MPNVNNVDCGQSARVYPCFHSRTQSTSAEGAAVGPCLVFFFSFSLCVALGAPPSHATPTPAPTECQRAPIPQYPPYPPPNPTHPLPNTARTRHLNAALTLRGTTHTLKHPSTHHHPPIPLPPPSQTTPPPPQFVLIYLFRRVFEVEAFFHLLEFSPSPFDAPPPDIENFGKKKVMYCLELRE